MGERRFWVTMAGPPAEMAETTGEEVDLLVWDAAERLAAKVGERVVDVHSVTQVRDHAGGWKVEATAVLAPVAA